MCDETIRLQLHRFPVRLQKQRAARNKSKYAAITLTHIFVSVEVETLGPIIPEGLRFLHQIGGRLSAVNGERRRKTLESSFLYQRLYVLVQSFNMTAFRGSFISETDFEV